MDGGFVQVAREDVVDSKYDLPGSWSKEYECRFCKSKIILREKYLFVAAFDNMKKLVFKCACDTRIGISADGLVPSAVYRRILEKNMFVCKSAICTNIPHSEFSFFKSLGGPAFIFCHNCSNQYEILNDSVIVGNYIVSRAFIGNTKYFEEKEKKKKTQEDEYIIVQTSGDAKDFEGKKEERGKKNKMSCCIQ
jgi:hypothetical protein